MVWAFKKRQSKLVVNRSFFPGRPLGSTNKGAFPEPASLEQRSEEIMGGLCKLSLFSQPDSGGGVCDIDCPWTWVLYPQGPRRSQAGDPLSRSQYYKEELLVVEGYHVLPGGFFFWQTEA